MRILSFRAAIRGLRNQPGYAACFVATLALTIGAATAVFTMIQGYLLSPLPFPHQERLDVVRQSKNRPGTNDSGYAVKTFWDLEGKLASYEHLGAYMRQDAL